MDSTEKPAVMQEEDITQKHTPKDSADMGAFAAAQGTSTESFAHLDEKKILRKVKYFFLFRTDHRDELG